MFFGILDFAYLKQKNEINIKLVSIPADRIKTKNLLNFVIV